jgi:RNA polymerase sigma-70 factor, ECF subfamily
MKAGPHLSDTELMPLMLAGDEEAFSLIYDRRHAGIYRFALQMCGSPSTAEDITQEVFIFLMREGRVFDSSRASLNAFLMGVARNYTLRRLRGDQGLVALTDDSEDDGQLDQPFLEPGPLEELTRTETIEQVRRAVLSLPQKYREVVVLCELQEMSYVETAEVLGCAIGTVRSRLHRARTLLLEKLRPLTADDAAAASAQSARCFA